MSHEVYDNPLVTRYASPEMCGLWSARRKAVTWRRLWIALAEAQAELGLPIRREQIAEMSAQLETIDFAAIERYELSLRHDVMAHVHAFGDVCPQARAIIHLGATSTYVTDNADLLLIRESLSLIRARLLRVIDRLATFAEKHRDLACLGLTHYQPAQPTTVGKRACLWAYDLVQDLEEIDRRLASLKAHGARGATGTQASFLELFHGDEEKVKRLDALIAERLGFTECYPVVGQTYPRKVDAQVMAVLSGIAASAYKAAGDLRLLQGRKELEEPFEKEQIGSSAMAYKRNPMRSERICSLARFVLTLESAAPATHAAQWLERTLDDSAVRRLVLPQAFMAVDAVLILYQNVVSGLVVYPAVIARNLAEELPFLATENLLMAATTRGGDRQELHERIRRHSMAAAAQVRQGSDNDLMSRLQADPAFAGVDFSAALAPERYVGRAAQVTEFLADVVGPIRKQLPTQLGGDADVRV